MPRPKKWRRQIGETLQGLRPQELSRCPICEVQVPVAYLAKHRKYTCWGKPFKEGSEE